MILGLVVEMKRKNAEMVAMKLFPELLLRMEVKLESVLVLVVVMLLPEA